MILPPDDLLKRLESLVQLGHKARDASFLRQAELAISSPQCSLPQAAGRCLKPMANLMSLYRFLDNDEIPVSSLRDVRSRCVIESIPSGAGVLVVHDVSQLDYTRQDAKTDRRLIGDHGGKGYEYVPCLALDPVSGQFYGVLHDTLIDASGPDDRSVMDYQYEPLFAGFSAAEQQRLRENHRHQMAVHINGLSPALTGFHVTHVADREFDDVFLMDCCQHHGHDFVVRSSGLRNVQVKSASWIPKAAHTKRQAGHPLSEGFICVKMKSLVQAVSLMPYKSLPLDSKGRVTEPQAAVRTAALSIGSCPVRLYRQAMRNQQYFRPPRILDVTMVVIRETDPPAGIVPLCWVLFTSLPTDTWEQLLWVGHLYELRWRVEEFFKLLKSGYRIESTRMDNSTKTAKMLVLLTLAAMTVIQMKAELGIPAGGRLPDSVYAQVKTATREPENERIDLRWRLFAFIAAWGGWLGRRNDVIGSTILMRGINQLVGILNALDQCGGLIEELRKNPDILRRPIRV